jgi:sigma-B regulation protein RsbU (phosphoserine phosphatase)
MQKNIVLTNDLQEVPRLNDFVEKICEEVGFDQDNSKQIKEAVEEAVINVIKYAYPSGTHSDVTIEAASNETRLKFTIIDKGKPFDPTVQTAVDSLLPVNERHGGQGIHIMRQNMDSINYERLDKLNVLTLRKKIVNNKL